MGDTDADTILVSGTKFRTISHTTCKLKVRFVVKFGVFFLSFWYTCSDYTHFGAVFVVKTG